MKRTVVLLVLVALMTLAFASTAMAATKAFSVTVPSNTIVTDSGKYLVSPSKWFGVRLTSLYPAAPLYFAVFDANTGAQLSSWTPVSSTGLVAPKDLWKNTGLTSRYVRPKVRNLNLTSVRATGYWWYDYLPPLIGY